MCVSESDDETDTSPKRDTIQDWSEMMCNSVRTLHNLSDYKHNERACESVETLTEWNKLKYILSTDTLPHSSSPFSHSSRSLLQISELISYSLRPLCEMAKIWRELSSYHTANAQLRKLFLVGSVYPLPPPCSAVGVMPLR